MDRSRIVIVTEGGPHIWAIVNALSDKFGSVTAILETPESKARLLRRRAKKLGWISVAGQAAMMVLTRLSKKALGKRMARLAADAGLDTDPGKDVAIERVPSAESPEFLAAIGSLKPGVILLAGCRMLSSATLSAIDCPVLNYHAGIAPKYRGMNGGYWALATGDPRNFGTTVHLVDAGVDTGDVLYQVLGRPEPGDNFMLYALRQATFSRDACIRAVEDALVGRLSPFKPQMPSRQWHHPTIWFYIWTGLTKGVW